MSDTSTNLGLPYLMAAQSQKHVSHNEAMRLLDALVQLSMLDRDRTAPPTSSADGDRHLVASGLWAGWDLNIAFWADGSWIRLVPRTGWRMWLEDEGLLLVYDGAGWVGPTPSELQGLALIGLGTMADASNPFSAKLNAALWTAKTVAEGGTGDLFYTMNKKAASDDLGLTLQTGFVTKALLSLFGSDRFRLAVSDDGSAFLDGLIVDNATGIIDQPRLPRFKAHTNYDNHVGVGTWTKIGINKTDCNDQGAFDAGNNRFMAPADGTYHFGATLLFKVNASTSARMCGRLALNGTTEIRGSMARSAGPTFPLRRRSGFRPWRPSPPAIPSNCRGFSDRRMGISLPTTPRSGGRRSGDGGERMVRKHRWPAGLKCRPVLQSKSRVPRGRVEVTQPRHALLKTQPLVQPRDRRKLEPAWWAPCGFAAIPTAALDPAHGPASPAVPAPFGSGSPSVAALAYSPSAGKTDSISAIVWNSARNSGRFCIR